jgi:hypothetical protein
MSKTVFVRHSPWLDIVFVREQLKNITQSIDESYDFDKRTILRGEKIILELLYKALQDQQEEN